MYAFFYIPRAYSSLKGILFLCLSMCCFYSHAQITLYRELLYSGQHKELIQLIQNEIPDQNITGDTACTLAQASEGLLKYRQAYTYYGRWLSHDSTSVEALNATARMALQLGRIQEGEELYLKSYTIDSMNFNSGLQLAKLYYQLRDFDKAYRYYYALLLQDTTNISLLTSVGDCLYEMGNPYSVNFYMEALDLNKENVPLSIKLINNMLDLRNQAPVYMDISMNVCDTALVYNPNNHSLLRSKGVIHYLRKEYHPCDSIMSNLIAEGDSTLMNFRYVSLAKYNDNLFFDALPYMEHYYQNDTTNMEALMLLGVSLGRTYDRRRALYLFDQVEKKLQPPEELLENLSIQRGKVHQANGPASTNVAANYYWQAYLYDGRNRLSALSLLKDLYGYINRTQLEEADSKRYAQILFANVAYLKEVQQNLEESKNENRINISTAKHSLSLFLEDMLFLDVNRLLMELPDGKTEWVTLEELERLSK